jgi:hypothetical protein
MLNPQALRIERVQFVSSPFRKVLHLQKETLDCSFEAYLLQKISIIEVFSVTSMLIAGRG